MEIPNENHVSFATEIIEPLKDKEDSGEAGERLASWLLKELSKIGLNIDEPYPNKKKGVYPAHIFSWVIPINSNNQVLGLHCAADPYKEKGWQLQFHCEDSFWKCLFFGENKEKIAAREATKEVFLQLLKTKDREEIYDIEWWDP